MSNMPTVTTHYTDVEAIENKVLNADFSFDGELELIAKLHDPEEDAKTSLPKIKLLANTGGRMPGGVLGVFDDVVIDMKGAKFENKITPIIADHETSQRIGHTVTQDIQPGKIIAEGVVSSNSDTAQQFVADSKNGFPFQVSIGAKVIKAKFIDEGQETEINGRTFKGPLIVASKTSIKEITITTLGGDAKTSAKLVAKNNSTKKDNKMTFDEYLKSIGLEAGVPAGANKEMLKAAWKTAIADPLTTTLPTEPVITAGGVTATASTPIMPTVNQNDDLAALQARRDSNAIEETRLDSIRAVAAKFSKVKDTDKFIMSDLKAKAIKGEITIDNFELQCMYAEVPEVATPAIHMAQQLRDVDSAAIACAALRCCNTPAKQTNKGSGNEYGLEVWYDQKTLEASEHKELKSVSLHQIYDMLIRASGRTFSGSRTSHAFLNTTREAMRDLQASSGASTLGATQIFDDLANKAMWAGYNSVGTVWQEIGRVQNVNDFKTHNVYQLFSDGAYQQLGADGELKHGTLSDTKFTHSADTHGKIYGLDRKHQINDDLGALNTLMTGLGIEGARSLEEVVLVAWLTNATTTWATGNKNVISGATSVLSVGGIDLAQQTFMDQVRDDAPIGIFPDRILIGTVQVTEATQIFTASDVREGRSGTKTIKDFTSNPHVGAFRPIISPYLNNTSVLQRVTSIGTAIPFQSTTQWFMLPSPDVPEGSTMIVSLLNGNRTPVLEQADMSFDRLGTQWRAYHDFGADIADPILSVRSLGA